MKKKFILTDLVSSLLILLFVYTALSKLSDYHEFKVQISKSPLLYNYASIIAIGIPGIELLVSGLLFVNRLQMIGLYASYTLMVAFTVYIINILTFSSYIPCSCGGILQNMTWTEHLWFNFFIIGLCVVAIFTYKPKKTDLTQRV